LRRDKEGDKETRRGGEQGEQAELGEKF